MNARIKGRNYRFEDCSFTNAVGQEVQIPNGIWSVAELDMVSVFAGTKIYDMTNPQFQLLKLAKKAVLVD